jgi:hypothetical protein
MMIFIMYNSLKFIHFVELIIYCLLFIFNLLFMIRLII